VAPVPHAHDFKDWPFAEPIETGVFTTVPVMERREPVRLVSHDSNGDWQFLCDTTLEPNDLKIVCLGCALEADDTLREVADLPLNWYAERDAVGGEWKRAPRPPEWDEDDEDDNA
jgi:hypothetical protein